MVTFMCAVDDSLNAKCAFFATLNLIKKDRGDKIILVNVMEDIASIAATGATLPPSLYYPQVLEGLRMSSKRILHNYHQVCNSFHVSHSLHCFRFPFFPFSCIGQVECTLLL